MSCPAHKPSVERAAAPEPEPEPAPDPMAAEAHQRVSLLLYSYSAKSPNVPDFCVNPWIVTMEMYGRHDISLGAFLDKYCFNSEYKCTSNSCAVPHNQHVRRFVHNDICVTITCNTIGHSNADKLKGEQNKQVMFWSRCDRCNSSGVARRLSRTALCLSLAQYLQWLTCARRRLRAHCPHPLHAHAHSFLHNFTTASCRINKISMYEIHLPPDMITIDYDTKQMRDSLIAQLNDLMLKGHEIFNGLTDSEAEKECQTFKQHMEQIHLALAAPDPQDHASLAGKVRALWGVADRIIAGDKMLRDAHDKWSSPAAKPAKSSDATVEDKSDLEDSAGDGNDSSGTTYMFGSDSTRDSEKEHTGTEEDEEKGDKKTVRQILSQLLSNNQPANQGGIIISHGAVPVVVRAGGVGSVVAATLASVACRRTTRHSTQTEHEEADNGREKSDSDKQKTKSNEHVEVLLKDGLLCRVYYAVQFQNLRHMLLAPLDGERSPGTCCRDERDRGDKSVCEIEEAFIRSLAHCVPWAAKGGKSGSTFCKTKDDRYVLKEMTKPEWQQFLEFAPHYFSYVEHCRQNNLPSLLARILGVYSVGGAGNGVLVIENIWYRSAPPELHFDLKGSSRHRLTPDAAAAVLMDENLLHLRWERQLYVRSSSFRVLWSALTRDTALLSARHVMDYSLLLALRPHSLALGIIDYIRTFTWDKKLEHLVKKNLGSGQPTVVSPQQYERRFLAAARKYFLHCPEHWHLLHAEPA